VSESIREVDRRKGEELIRDLEANGLLTVHRAKAS
jgi:hypothetical protein